MSDNTSISLSKRGWTAFSTLPEKKKNRIYLTCALVVSLAIKTVLLIMLHDAAINDDGTLYIKAAMEFAAGNFSEGIDIYPMPAYPILLAAAHMIIPDWIMAGYFVSIASMVLVTFPSFHITRNSAGPRAAFWACLIFAVLPKMNEWSLYISRDPIFLLCVSCFVFFALQSIRRTDLMPFVAALILAFGSMLFRVEGCIVLFFYLTLLTGLALFKKEHRRLYLFRAALWVFAPAVIAGIFLVLSGAEILSINRLGDIYKKLCQLFNGEFLQSYHNIYQFFSEAEKHEPFSGLHYNLAALARHYIFLLYTAGIIEILLKNIFFLSAVPLFVGIKTKEVSHTKFLLWLWALFIIFAYYCLLTKDFLATRFLMIPAFLLIPWIGAGTEKLRAKAFHSRRKKMALLLVAMLIIAPAAKSFEQVSDKDDAVPKAAKWLKSNGMISKSRIMTNEKTAVFYTGLYAFENLDTQRNIFFYNLDNKLAEIETAAKKKKVDILLIKIDKNAKLPELKRYELIKQFTDSVGTVLLCRRANT